MEQDRSMNKKDKKEISKKVIKESDKISECPFCSDQKKQIIECVKSHNVKPNIKNVIKHLFFFSDCKLRLKFIKDFSRNKHME